MTLPELVYVEWLDHCSESTAGSWTTRGAVKRLAPQLVYSVGFILAETNDYLTVAAHIGIDDGDDEQVGGDLLILKSCIKVRKELRG